MDGKGSDRVKEVFGGALELSGGERSSYLDRQCGGDAGLKAEVEGLLAAAERTGALMGGGQRGAGSGGGGEETLDPGFGGVLSEGPGTWVGPYKLWQQMGEGGFGVVFMAEQERPIRRRVALKVVKLGMDTRQVVARFEAERQALAMMDHPNIARVFDAGSTATGRPYFVMELVRGVPITKYCDEHKLPIGQRVELFREVCSAVQHAHQKGIIHRDLKPNNVLVEVHDDKPVPKVIDFGIAKATQTRLTDKTLFTEFRQMIGTPAYMSPEQAQLSGLDIDTRSDVYSLGVLLYELLTGSTPFDARELLSAAFDEMRRIIREVEPPAPSTRLSASQTLGTVAVSRAAAASSLPGAVRGELDWIVMRCLEKDRTRRYESASALAADLGRYLVDEPVCAGPPSGVYRARKFVRRHRGAVVSAAALAVALLLGIVGTSVGLVGQSRARGVAQAQRDLAVASEARALAGEAEARTQAAEAAQQRAVSEAVVKFQADLLTAADPERLLGDKVTVLQAVTSAVRELNAGRLRSLPLVESGVRDTIGMTLRSLGKYGEAEAELRKSLKLRRAHLPANHLDVAWAAGGVGNILSDQGKNAEAEPLFRECLEIRLRLLPPESALIGRAMMNLGDCLAWQGRYEEAIALMEAGVSVLRGSSEEIAEAELPRNIQVLAKAYMAVSRLDDAERLSREGLKLYRERRPAGHPFVGGAAADLVGILTQKGLFREAEPLAREALSIVRAAYPKRHLKVAGSAVALSQVLNKLERFDEAESLSREALPIFEEVFGLGNLKTVGPLNCLAEALDGKGRKAEALDLIRRIDEINAKFPNVNISDGGVHLHNVATRLEREGKFEEAEATYRQAIAETAIKPGENTLAMGSSRSSLGKFLVERGRFAEAEPELTAAIAVRRRLLPPGHVDLARSVEVLGACLIQRGQAAQAEPLLREAREAYLNSLPVLHVRCQASTRDLVMVLYILGKDAEAIALDEEYRQLLRLAATPTNGAGSNYLSWVGGFLHDSGRYAAAEPAFRALLENQLLRSPQVPLDSAFARHMLGRTLAAASRFDEALLLLDAALWTFMRDIPPASPQIASTRIVRGRCLTGLKRFAEAEESLLSAEESIRGAGVPSTHPMYLRVATDLAALYGAWSHVEPSAERAERAAMWRDRIPATQAATAPAKP